MLPCQHLWLGHGRQFLFYPCRGFILTEVFSVISLAGPTSCAHEPQLTIPMHEIITLEKKMTAFVIPNAILITTKNGKYAFASFLSRDNTYEVIHNSWRMSGADISGNGAGSMRTSFDSAESGRTGMEGVRANGVDDTKPQEGGKAGPGKAPKVTMCQCGKDGSHYTEVVMETVFPGTPEKIHNLIFASGFIKDFMREDQKLRGACLSVYEPQFHVTWGVDWHTDFLLIPAFLFFRYADFGLGAVGQQSGKSPIADPQHVLHQASQRFHRTQTDEV